MKHSILCPAWYGALAIALMVFVVPISYADKPTDRQCLDAYLDSKAASSCEGSKTGTPPYSVNVFVNRDGKCVLADTCPTEEGEPWRSYIIVKVDYAADLINCNGVLKLASCD